MIGRQEKQGLGRIMPLVGQLSCLVRCQISEACHKAGYPLTPEQTTAFMVLHHFQDIRQSMLAHILDKDKASVSRLTNSLVEMGLAERRPDEHDRRAVRLLITGKGLRAFDDIFPAIREISGIALKDVSEAELSTIERCLSLMIENLSSLKCQNR
jgi:DNA-binding MarR family transcriptional regulator